MVSIGVQPYQKPANCEQLIISIQDTPNAKITPYLDRAADFINTAMGKGKVLVHCYAGVSRSASCVIAYLIKYKGMGYFNALYFCRQQRSIVCPN